MFDWVITKCAFTTLLTSGGSFPSHLRVARLGEGVVRLGVHLRHRQTLHININQSIKNQQQNIGVAFGFKMQIWLRDRDVSSHSGLTKFVARNKVEHHQVTTTGAGYKSNVYRGFG